MKSRLLYFYTNRSSFLLNDIEIFKKEFEVIESKFLPSGKISTLICFFNQFIFLIRNIKNTKILICFFGGYHSFLPALFSKLFNKTCLVFPGGADSVAFPSINYGNFIKSKNPMGWFTKKSYQWANHLVPVSESLSYVDYTFTDTDFPCQGFRYHCPGLKTPHTTIHLGYNSDSWIKTKEKIPNTFLTLAGFFSVTRMNIKGIDLFIEVANFFPHCTFYIIGPQTMTINIPKNVILVPPLKFDELKDYLSFCEFYMQLSLSEGFPSAPCEAMLMECIPICSNVGAMPIIVGDAGYILEEKNISKLRDIINLALNSNRKELAMKARNQIISNFSDEKRNIELIKLINKFK